MTNLWTIRANSYNEEKMGREIKRVALDFSHELNKVLPGYVNPHYKYSHNCYDCAGSGYDEMADYYRDQWYGYVAFDPVAYGSKLFTSQHPILRKIVELKIDREISENPVELCYYTGGGLITRDEAVEQEIKRLCSLFNGSWCYHLIEADVQALLDCKRLHDFTNRPLPGVPLEDYIRTYAY